MDYGPWKLSDLRAELNRQALLHEAAAKERKAIAAEILRREKKALMKERVNAMTPDDKDALLDVLTKP